MTSAQVFLERERFAAAGILNKNKRGARLTFGFIVFASFS